MIKTRKKDQTLSLFQANLLKCPLLLYTLCFMIGLILDTSTDLCLIGLSQDHTLLDSLVFPHEQNLAKTLLPSIQDLLFKNQLHLKEISKIAVGIGPGSYTGTRVAVTVAQTLSFGASLPLCSFCSPLAFLPPKLPQGPFAFIINSAQGHFFLLKGYQEEGRLQKNLTRHMLSPQELPSHLTDTSSILSFNPEKLSAKYSEITSSKHLWIPAQPNFSFLIPHLTSQPTSFEQIIYLHAIS